MIASCQTMPATSHPIGTSERLVKLLQQSAVEHLTTLRQLEAQEFSSVYGIATTDFEALYAYKCGEYQRCLQLSTDNVRMLFGITGKLLLSRVSVYPEFIQLMDDGIVSLVGLTMTVNTSRRHDTNSVS